MCRSFGRSSSLIRLTGLFIPSAPPAEEDAAGTPTAARIATAAFQSPKSHHYTDSVEHALIQSRALIRQGWHSFGWMHLKQDLASNAGRQQQIRVREH